MSIPDQQSEPQGDWRPAATRCGRFEVSKDGRVRNRFTEREISLNLLNGYPGFVTRKTRKGRAYAYKAHRLVTEAFHGPQPTPKHEVNHKDGVKTNNHADNLEWVTSAQNTRHSFRIGLQKPIRGERQGNAKLSDEIVRHIRRQYRPGHAQFGCRALANKYGVHHSVVSKVVNGKAWAHVKDSRALEARIREREESASALVGKGHADKAVTALKDVGNLKQVLRSRLDTGATR